MSRATPWAGNTQGRGQVTGSGVPAGDWGLETYPQSWSLMLGRWLLLRDLWEGCKNWDSASAACLLPGTKAQETDWKHPRLWLVLWPLQCTPWPTLGTCISPSCSGATASSNVTPAATSKIYSMFKISFFLRGNTSNWKKWLILGLGYRKYRLSLKHLGAPKASKCSRKWRNTQKSVWWGSHWLNLGQK